MGRFRFRRATKLVAVLALVGAPSFAVLSQTAASAAAPVTSADALRLAFIDPLPATPRTIDLGSNITITDCTTAPWLRSSSGDLVIDGHGFTVTQTCPNVGIFNSDGSGNLTFQNITLTGGSAGDTSGDNGGAISAGLDACSTVGLVTVINSTITNNTAPEDGGAIWGMNSVNVQGSTVSNNSSTGTGGGGGIAALGHVTVTNSTITNNHTTGAGDGGGGIAVAAPGSGDCARSASSTDGGITVTSSAITNNTAFGEGGGFAVEGPVTVTDSTIANNNAAGPTADSGGFDTESGAIVTRSTISGNTATGDGGGFETFGDTTVTNSTITNNKANGWGGGIHMWSGNLTLTYDTITSNTALGMNDLNPTATAAPEHTLKGARPHAAEATVGITSHSGFAANVQVDLCTDSWCFGGALTSFGTVIAQPLGNSPIPPNCFVAGSASSQGYNFSDEGATSPCGFTAGTDTHLATNDPKLGDLADNGGPTPTMTRLPLPGSPLIDAILTSACRNGSASGVTTDQRGVTRPQIKGCDIGAVEVKGASVTVTKVVTGTKGNAVPVAGGYSFAVTCTDGTSGPLTVADATLGGTSGTLANILPGSTCTVVEAPVVYDPNSKVVGQPPPGVAYNPASTTSPVTGLTAALTEGQTATVTVTNDYSGVNLLGVVAVLMQPRFTG